MDYWKNYGKVICKKTRLIPSLESSSEKSFLATKNRQKLLLLQVLPSAQKEAQKRCRSASTPALSSTQKAYKKNNAAAPCRSVWGGFLVYAPESAEIWLESILAQKEYRNTSEAQKGTEGHLTAFQNVQKGIEEHRRA